jgi:hypothetical protein
MVHVQVRGGGCVSRTFSSKRDGFVGMIYKAIDFMMSLKCNHHGELWIIWNWEPSEPLPGIDESESERLANGGSCV